MAPLFHVTARMRRQLYMSAFLITGGLSVAVVTVPVTTMDPARRFEHYLKRDQTNAQGSTTR